MDRERELPVNPEVVWGREFRVPAIIGQGSGLGFEFSGLHLPRRWEKAIPELQKINYDGFRNFFKKYCQEKEILPGEINYDSSTGVLTEITVATTSEARLSLSQHFPYTQEGVYRGENVDNILVAITLQMFTARFLNRIWREIGSENTLPYIDGEPRRYYSVNLKIPKEFLKPEKPLTNTYFQERFEVGASNIAGRFGLTLRTVSFDERGILRIFDIREGNACGYYLDSSGQYHGHNVDDSYQAATLHGIGASFINHLLKTKDGQPY